MSTIDSGHDAEMDDLMSPQASAAADDLPRLENPIVPNATIAGRALIAVIAIMTFLGSLTIGAVMLARAAAVDWQSELAREVTIQVRSVASRDIEADVARAETIARGFPGIADVHAYSREESARLLEPWLGSGLSFNDLPVPRIIVVRLAPGATPDLAQLRRALAEQVPPASLDDHRGFVDRMRTMANTAMIGGLAVLTLVLLATVLSVMFATRGAMAANRSVIEVLHFIGAKMGFIAGHFQRRFFMLGLKGGAIGAGGALLLFGLADAGSRWMPASAADQFVPLLGTLSIGIAGYAAIAGQVLLIALVAALTSRVTVNRVLDTIQ
jgi:cell division transport system permease protein